MAKIYLAAWRPYHTGGHTASSVNWNYNYNLNKSLALLSQRSIMNQFDMKPDPNHRIYSKAPKSRLYKKNIWVERICMTIVILLLKLFVFGPLYLCYEYCEFEIPITKRRQFLFLPLWLDQTLGIHCLKILQIIDTNEFESRKNNIDMHVHDVTKQESNENDNLNTINKHKPNARFQISFNNIETSDENIYVKNIENIFLNILISNNLYIIDENNKKKTLKYFIENTAENNCSGIESEMRKFERFQSFKWELIILENYFEEDINAVALPGGKIIIHADLIRKLKLTDDEYAAVICHEIAHVVCRHNIASFQFLSQYFMIIICLIWKILPYLDIDIGDTFMRKNSKLLKAVDILFGWCVQQPRDIISRSHKMEYEADQIGMCLMLFSGYNPYGMVTMLKKFQKVEILDEFYREDMSTHPDTHKRINRAKKILLSSGLI